MYMNLIIGRTGSGKTEFARLLENLDMKKVKSYTTRPKRQSETDDDYHFISKSDLDNYQDKLALTTINQEQYFVTKDELLTKNIYVIDYQGAIDLAKQTPDITYHIIHILNPDDNLRLNTLKTRYYQNNPKKDNESDTDYQNRIEILINKRNASENKQFTELENLYKSGKLLETLPDGIVIMNKSTQKHIYRNKYMIEEFKNIGIDRFNKIIEDYIDSAEFDKEKIVNLNKKQNASVLITDIKSENIYIIIFKILENNQKIRDIREKIKKTQQTESFKTQFCIDVVDKIKKPVDNLLYENSIMKDYAKSPIVENHVTLVRRNLYRLKKVLDNINDIMDIENRSYNLNYVVFDVVSLIKDISNLSKYYIDRKGLSLEIEFSDEEILVYLDSIKLQKIILNILSNAIKFTDKGGKIKISVYRKIDFIVINIKDSGIGIPKDQMNFIFENFEQIDRGLSRLAEGMGIGLYLVKQLAEIQDLYLNVDSELNKGSEFKILIKNRENSFLKKRYKKDICIKKEFVDIQFADIYPA